MTTNQSVENIAINGVYYGIVKSGADIFRIGSLLPDWQARLTPLGFPLRQAGKEKIEQEGIFVDNQEKELPLAIMCGGLGAAWPGMGRELYDNYLAARDAMEELASLADWDLLGLMDEKSSETVNSPRFQIPYLFLLEYAQWSVLRNLGLKPNLICGHSLGELVALCLAGVYPVEAAWLLLDTRARHMAQLEERGKGESGMLAVSAEKNIVDKILLDYPDLALSNANSPRQFVFGGPRKQLLEVRKKLRHNRIPAFMLPISLAFHNPAMRVLRDLSTRRLEALEMHPPAIPLLSCVTAGPYPENADEICKYIADLDENTVDWTNSVKAMRSKHKIGIFVELGPQDILCNLVHENASDVLTIATDRKGHELEAMRRACARLFSLGKLPFKRLSELAKAQTKKLANHSEQVFPKTENGPMEWQGFAGLPETTITSILNILAKISGFKKEELRPDQDLKYDLGLRSSNFPLLLQELEEQLKIEPDFENIFKINTVGDLVLMLGGNYGEEKDQAPEQKTGSNPAVFSRPLRCFSWLEDKGFSTLTILANPERHFYKIPGPVSLLTNDPPLLCELWEGLAAQSYSFIVPQDQLEAFGLLAKSGSHLEAIQALPGDNPLKSTEALLSIPKDQQPQSVSVAIKLQDLAESSLALLEASLGNLAEFSSKTRLKGLISLFIKAPMTPELNDPESIKDRAAKIFRKIKKHFPASENFRCILLFSGEGKPKYLNRNEPGDLFALSILCGQASFELWMEGDYANGEAWRQLPQCPPDNFFFLPPGLKEPDRSGSWHAEGQYSLFSQPDLQKHGQNGIAWCPEREELQTGYPSSWLPAGEAVSRLLYAGNLARPWLLPASLQDVNFFRLPELAPGISRECSVEALFRPWLMQSGLYSRLCKIEMRIRQLKPNGRRIANWLAMCDCIAAYATKSPKLVPLWTKMRPEGKVAPAFTGKFYSSIDFEKPWQLIGEAYSCGQNNKISLQFRISEKNLAAFMTASLAHNLEYGYSKLAYIIEILAQASYLATALRNGGTFDDTASIIQSYALSSIGYIKLDWPALMKIRQPLFELRLAWQQQALLRFDGQVYDGNCPILQMTHLELLKRAD